MEASIFEFSDYKAYLTAWLESQPAGGYGLKGKFAKAMGCQTAFVSQVLKGQGHFSLEQSDSLNPLLGHSAEESDFFLLLVQFTRAGTESLRQRLRHQMEAAAAKRVNLKDRLAATRELTKEDYATYFGSWTYSAAHMQLMVPPYQTKTSVAKALGLPLAKVATILEFLVDRGLAKQGGDHYSVGPMHLHLGKDSAIIAKHHMNWRLQAMQAIENEGPEDLHYSAVVVISKEDVKKLKALCADFLENTRQLITPSEEEELVGLCLDMFHVSR